MRKRVAVYGRIFRVYNSMASKQLYCTRCENIIDTGWNDADEIDGKIRITKDIIRVDWRCPECNMVQALKMRAGGEKQQMGILS